MIDCTANARDLEMRNNFWGDAFDDPIMRRWVKIVMHRFSKKFQYLGDGRHRVVYRHKNWVIKVPHNEAGIEANLDEYRLFKRNKFDKQCGIEVTCARCRMLNIFLVMEYVEISWNIENKAPSWKDFIDCGQVGLNRRGEYVAYDFGG